MKDVIAAIERNKENNEQLKMKNVCKTVIAKFAQVSNIIDLNSKYNWLISNTNMDTVEDLRLTDIKKYQRCAGLIQDKINWLYKI